MQKCIINYFKRFSNFEGYHFMYITWIYSNSCRQSIKEKTLKNVYKALDIELKCIRSQLYTFYFSNKKKYIKRKKGEREKRERKKLKLN